MKYPKPVSAVKLLKKLLQFTQINVFSLKSQRVGQVRKSFGCAFLFALFSELATSAVDKAFCIGASLDCMCIISFIQQCVL
jgi:hypothetical protein